MRQALGDKTVERLFNIYDGRVSREADLVCYWVEKARAAVARGDTRRVGLVTTNSIRGGANRKVLDHIAAQSRIFEAWSDEPWVVDGAAVRVSLVCFGDGEDSLQLNGAPVAQINSDLTAGTTDLTQTRRLAENQNVAFMGDTKGGAFDVPGSLARAWLTMPLNPNGRPNSDVLRPWRNGMDMTRRSRDMWIVDFGWEMSEQQAALYEAPFHYIKEHVWPERSKNRRVTYRDRWWRHVEARPALASRLVSTAWYIATARVAKHRLFVRTPTAVCPDSQIIAICCDSYTALGVLHSRLHELWSLKLGSSLEDRPRYTPTSTFETFPFPEGLTPNIPAIRYANDPRAIAIAAAAKRLDELRNAWLNPPDLVRIEPEVVSGYPDRILPKDTASAAILRERTLTNLYNRRPQWLIDAHRDLDSAVAEAYGWPADISDEEALSRLLALNLERASATALSARKTKPKRPVTPEEARQSPQLKLPIPGGRKGKSEGAASEVQAGEKKVTTSQRSKRRGAA